MTTDKDAIATPKLLPCPFCGGVDLRVYDNSVACHNQHCSATGPDLGHCIGPRCRADAIAAWNQRALMTTDKDATIARTYTWNGNIKHRPPR